MTTRQIRFDAQTFPFNAGHKADTAAFMAEQAAFDAAEQAAAERRARSNKMAFIAARMAEQAMDDEADCRAAFSFGFQMA